MLAHKLGLGTAQFGMPYGISRSYVPPGLSDIQDILICAENNGITVLDTAAAYGESEARLGKCLAGSKYSWRLISKIRASDSESVSETFAEICTRLQCQTLEGLLLHGFTNYLQHPKSLAQLALLSKEGLIRLFGVSLYHPEEAEWLLSSELRPSLVQVPYNLFDRRFESVLPKLKAAGITVHVRSVFLQGLLLMRPEDLSQFFVEIKPLLHELQQWHMQQALSPSWLPLHFVFSHPDIDCVIIGVERATQLKELIDTIAHRPLLLDLEWTKRFEVQNPAILLPYLWEE